MNNMYIEVYAKKAILDAYLNKRENKDYVTIEAHKQSLFGKAVIYGPTLFIDEIDKMMEENEGEYFAVKYHYDQNGYDGEHIYVGIGGDCIIDEVIPPEN